MISFIVPTIGRPSLAKTLASIECWPGDEVLLVGSPNGHTHPFAHHVPCPPGGDWGHAERNYSTPMARCRYIAHIDDDDVYAPGTRALMADDDADSESSDDARNVGVIRWRRLPLLGNVEVESRRLRVAPRSDCAAGAQHVKRDMYYWLRRALTPTWYERVIDWFTGRSTV
jgi:hypothetical protein